MWRSKDAAAFDALWHRPRGPSLALNVRTVVDLPVDQGYHDHPSVTIFWKLRSPEKGLALGSPAFNKPEYFRGSPMEWLVTAPTPHDELIKAAETDGISPDDQFVRKGPEVTSRSCSAMLPSSVVDLASSSHSTIRISALQLCSSCPQAVA